MATAAAVGRHGAIAVLQLLLIVRVLTFDVQVVLVVVAFLPVYGWVLTVSSVGHRYGSLPRPLTRFGLVLGRRFPVGLVIVGAGLTVGSGLGRASCLPGAGGVHRRHSWLALPVWPLMVARLVFSRPNPTSVQQKGDCHEDRVRVLAYVVAAEVAIQAMVMVWAVAGLGKWVQSGGVADAA